jgi:hypothetical protein
VSVTAVGVVLEPDRTMVDRAAADNARLRTIYPAGFALDSHHAPHITVLQRFVRTADLEAVESLLSDVFGGLDIGAIRLDAKGYYYIRAQGLGLAGITIESTGELRNLQRSIIDALAPLAAPKGGPDAFVGAPDTTTIGPTADYVEAFVAANVGAGYNPHVTIGMAPADYLDRMLEEPFERFIFAASSAAVYQLGDLGTAARLLWSSTDSSRR